MAEAGDFLQDGIDTPRIEAGRRQRRVTVLFGYAEDDISAAEIVEVIRC